MIKQADINDLLNGVKGQAADAGHQLMKWYGGLNPELRNTMVRGLAGAAVGGVAGHALAPADERGRKGLSPALLGMILGGGTAMALPAGLKMMGNGIKFRSESERPLGVRMLEAPGSAALNHPFAVGLPAFMAWKNNDAFGLLGHEVSARGGAGTGSILQRAKTLAGNVGHTLADNKVWSQFRAPDFTPYTQAMKTHGIAPMRRGGRGRMATVPLALLLGLAADKYMKGQW